MQRYVGSGSESTAAALMRLRQQSLPSLIAAPEFAGGTLSLPLAQSWQDRLRLAFARYGAFAAAIAAAALVVAAALPLATALQGEPSTAARTTIHSSAGVTGTASTRVEDLSAATFLGSVPFVQQSRFMSSAAAAPAAVFIAGARQASIADYLQGVGEQVALPYLGSTAATKEAVESWTAAVQAGTAASLKQVAAGETPFTLSTPAISPGTVVENTRTTFYSCLDGGFCDAMANGQQVSAGAAACSFDMPYGTRFVINADPQQRTYTCLDRGALVTSWVDIWFYAPAEGWAWQAEVGGTLNSITIVE